MTFNRPPEAGFTGEDPTPTTSQLSESELHQLMASNPMVQQALQMGLDSSRIKMAIKRRHREKGVFFKSLNQLIDSAFAEHIEQEDRHGVESQEASGGADECGIRSSTGRIETTSSSIETGNLVTKASEASYIYVNVTI